MASRRQPNWIRRRPIVAILVALAALFLVDIVLTRGVLAALGLLIAIPLILAIILTTLWKRRGVRAATASPHQPPSLGAMPYPAHWRGQTHQSPLYETDHPVIAPVPDAAGPVPATLNHVLALSPTEFEQLCVRAMLALGYRNVRRHGGAGDLNADITATDPQGRTVVVQCKRYAPGNRVGAPVIQTFIGMQRVHHEADRGIFMTTSEYTRPAIDLAKHHNLVLIDGDDLLKILQLTGTNVRV